MSTKLYFCGYRLEHFTNWDNSGIGTYYSIVSSDSSETNKLGYLTFYDHMNSALYDSVLWKTLDNKVTDTDAWISIKVKLDHLNVPGWTKRSNLNYYFVDSNLNSYGYSMNMIDSSGNGGESYLYPATYSTSSRFTLGTAITVNSYQSRSSFTYEQIHIHFQKKTTSNYDYIEIYRQPNQTSTYTLLYSGTLATPLVDISDFVIFSNSGAGSYQGIYSQFYYCYITNFDTRASYLDYTTISAVGTTNQWGGTTATFQTYPISYTATGGTTSASTDSSVSYALTKTLNAPVSTTIIPLAMILSSNDITDTGTATISPYMISGSNYTTTSDSSTVSTSGTTSNFYLTSNPLTNQTWTSTDIQNTQFGLTRTS